MPLFHHCDFGEIKMAENHKNKTLFSHKTRLLKKASNLHNRQGDQADVANAMKMSHVANSSQNEQSKFRTTWSFAWQITTSRLN